MKKRMAVRRDLIPKVNRVQGPKDCCEDCLARDCTGCGEFLVDAGVDADADIPEVE